MKAYKLLRIRRDGTLGSLFISRGSILPRGVWLAAEEMPTKKFKRRFGWHCTALPNAPHLYMNLANGEQRYWYEVEMDGVTALKRPACQGSMWYLAEAIKIGKRI
jgi:hypothetical protein